jgi:colicin import membrane protein
MAQSAPVERSSDRWASIILSVLLHGVLVVAVTYSWWALKEDRPAPTLALDATVVDARSVPGLGSLPPQPQPPPAPPPQPQPQPAETQPQVEPDGPPPPTPEELAKRDQEQKEQQERAEQEAKAQQQLEDRKRLEQERQQEAALVAEKAAEEKRVADRRQADEQQQKLAQEKAEAERKTREAAEAKKKADEQRLADQKQAEQQAADREADLKRSLDQELRQDAARSSGALASWQSQITARIRRAWLRPPSARSGIECVLSVTQVPGGEVTNVSIGSCNGDQAVRESIAAAVYRASPLPPPPDPTLFERNLVITFRPD